MFKEEEVREQAEAVPAPGKASNSEQLMDVDDEGKNAVAGAVTVDATKVAEDEGEEEKPSWADVGGDETM